MKYEEFLIAANMWFIAGTISGNLISMVIGFAWLIAPAFITRK